MRTTAQQLLSPVQGIVEMPGVPDGMEDYRMITPLRHPPLAEPERRISREYALGHAHGLMDGRAESQQEIATLQAALADWQRQADALMADASVPDLPQSTGLRAAFTLCAALLCWCIVGMLAHYVFAHGWFGQ